MSLKKQKNINKPELKPYGFCCHVDNHDSNLKTTSSLESLGSLHECPALRIVAQEIVKRPKRGSDGTTIGRIASRSPSAVQFAGSGGGGGMVLGSSKLLGGRMRYMPTESEISLAIDEARRLRQEEYERNMDRWADLAEKKVARDKIKVVKCLAPCWYVEFSEAQLKYLRRLEDAMFKDREEKTINRTWECLCSMGMMTDTAKLESKVVWKLVAEFSEDPLKFLCEIYKALTGKYFQDEGSRNDYRCHERIILSGIAFLELPKVIVELHKRLPPVEKWSFPPKPPRVMASIPKKMESPLLENLRLPVNWRLYQTQLFDWRKTCANTRRPVAILPKSKIVCDKNEEKSGDVEKTKHEGKVHMETDESETIDKSDGNHEGGEDSKRNSDSDPPVRDEIGKIENNKDEVRDEGTDDKDRELFPMKTDWTSPQTACPYKYRRILDQKGPLNTNEQFFAELGIENDEETKKFPADRENLSPNMQIFLHGLESDFYQLTQEADRITGAVNGILKQIQVAELACGPCCPCCQIKKQHSKWHAMKSSYNLIDGVAVDDENDKGQIIGTVALYSPASSVSTLSQPICIPSKEKFSKNQIIAGATITTDGETINLIEGFSKALERVPSEPLYPDPEGLKKNVPACECSKDELNDVVVPEKYENVCFGKKFRPDETPRAYVCPEFNECEKKVSEEEACDESCGCPETLECESEREDSDGDRENVREQCKAFGNLEKVKKDERKFCEGCGKWLEPSCAEQFSNKKTENGIQISDRRIANKCSCNSLSEFLKIDLLGDGKCIMPPREGFGREEKVKRKGSSNNVKSKKKAHKRKDKKDRKAASKERRKRSVSEKRKEKIADEKSKPPVENEEEEEEEEEKDRGGPYGLRTASEEALPPELTVAYLVDRHPPDVPADMVPVREGGRPCRCRENRNNRKTLIYNIGAVSDEPGKFEPLVEGVHWLTPVPSVRRSEEYIPEYELYDSPYGKPRKKNDGVTEDDVGVVDENDAVAREKGWKNAINDDYLTEFYTSKRGRSPCCGDVCVKRKVDQNEDAEPLKKLKVMKPVCECKYERKIVKRKEERKRWADRQQRLKSMDKQSYLHIAEITETPMDEKEEEEEKETEAQMVLAAVVMQTPCVTPSPSRAGSNLPFVPFKGDAMNELVPTKENDKSGIVASKGVVGSGAAVKRDSNKKQQKQQSRKTSAASVKRTSKTETEKSTIADKNDTTMSTHHQEDTKVERRRTSSFFNETEEHLRNMIADELKLMAEEEDGFVTIKLPDYHMMPQILYWVSYRVRGMQFTAKYKKKLMNESVKTWRVFERKVLPDLTVESLELSKKEQQTFNFDHAQYWKRKLAKKQDEFYTELRHQVVNFGRGMWRTMEYGKCPNVLFKQAFFTYLPAREKDALVFRSL